MVRIRSADPAFSQKGSDRMTKIDIVSGFLGAGKTTLIKKLIKDALAGTRVVLIENEFGEIGIDGGFLKEAGIEIREMNSGCICCSLVGDFGTSLREVMNQYAPDRILIEPSGVGKLSDVMQAVRDAAEGSDMALNTAVAVVDASKCKLYMKNFGEFFINQIECAGTIILTRTDKASQEKIAECVEILREHNPKATIITTPLAELDGKQILATIMMKMMMSTSITITTITTMKMTMRSMSITTITTTMKMTMRSTSITITTTMKMTMRSMSTIITTMTMIMSTRKLRWMRTATGSTNLTATIIITITTADMTLMRSSRAGEWRHLRDIPKRRSDRSLRNLMIQRPMGLFSVPRVWFPFDYVPEETEVRYGAADVTGKICVIGSGLKEDALADLFRK